MDNDYVREKLFMIINARYNNYMNTVFTTNCTSKELILKLGNRTFSRIQEMCRGNIFNLDKEKDWRKELNF